MSFWLTQQAKKISTASGTQGGLYFQPGTYIAQIQRCKMFTTNSKHEAFIAEFRVLESNNENLKENSEPALFIDLDGKYPDSAVGDMADFIRVALASLAEQSGEDHPPVEEIELEPATGEAVTGEDNLLAGTIIDVYAYNKPTKSGKDFTKFKWRIPENAQELAEKYAE